MKKQKYSVIENGFVKFTSNSYESAVRFYNALCKDNPKSNVVFRF